MDGELDYIISAYSTLKLSGMAGLYAGGSPLKNISLNHSPSKINEISPGKRSSAIVKGSPNEVFKICSSAIELGMSRLNKMPEVSNSLVRLISSSFLQLYKLDSNQRSSIIKKHQTYIVRLIDLESNSLNFKYSSRELMALFINNYNYGIDETNLESIDLLELNCPATLKFFILQIEFKKFHKKKYDKNSISKLLNFFLKSSEFLNNLLENQKPILIRLLLSFAKFSPDNQFKLCTNLKFLQLLDQFEFPFDSFITNLSKSKFIKDIEIELMTIKEFEKIPFFLFEFSMNDKDQIFRRVNEFYEKILKNNENYIEIDWKLINPDSSSCKKLLKLLQMSNINKDILSNELKNLGKPNASIIDYLGKFIIKSLDKPDLEIQSIIEFYIKNIDQLNKSNLLVIDKFLVSSIVFSSPKFFSSSIDFIDNSFNLLKILFSKNGQSKRLNNISNLYYNFSLKSTNIEIQKKFISNSLSFEILNFKNDPSNSDLNSKFEKCLEFLITKSISINEIFNLIFSTEIFDSVKSNNLLHKIDLVQKYFGTPLAFQNLKELKLSNTLLEQDKSIIFVLASKYCSNNENLLDFFNSLNINEPILKMLCGISFNQLPIVKSSLIKKSSVSNSTGSDSLIKPFYYLIQEIKNKLNTNLPKIINLYIQEWANKNKFSLTSFEIQFLFKLVDYLNFINFHKNLKFLLNSIQKYKEFNEIKQFLQFTHLNNELNLGQNVSISLLNPKLNELDSNYSIQFLNIKILNLKYYLLNFNKIKLIEISEEISEFLIKNEAFFHINNKYGHPKGKYIKILILLVKLHHYRGKILFLLGEHLESLLSFCNSIRISKAVLNRNVESFETLKLVSSNFRYIIKILIHLGISKDSFYYSQELIKFNDSIIKNKILFIENNYFLSYFNFIVGNFKSCEELKLKSNEIFDSLDLIQNNDEYLDNFKLIYYKYLSDIYLLSEDEDEIINLQINLKNFLKFMDKESKILSINWKLNYEYVFNSDISLKNSKNPYILTMDLMINSRKLFIDAQNILNIDPLFSTLEDSAMSIPSAHKEDGDIFSTSFKNKIKNLKNLKKSITNLKQSKEICLNLFKDLKYLSNYHINEIHKVLSLDLLTLSSISNSYNYESIEDSYKLNDYLKNQPLINEKRMIDITALDSHDKSLLPNFNFDKLTYKVNEINKSEIDSELLNKMPEDWLVITIDICSFNGDLIISNFEKGLKTPTFLRLPLSRHSSRIVDEQSFSFKDALNELNSILEKSNATTTKERVANINSSEERRQWHEERFSLDQSLKQLLTKIEYCWIGGFKGIFNQEQISDEQIKFFKNKFLNIIRENIPSRSQRNNKPVEIDDFVIKLFLKLGDPSKLMNTELLEDLIYFVLDILLFHGEENAYDEIDIDNMYVQVENLINEYIQSNPNPKKNKHTVLILGKECLLLPWESLPCLRNTSTTRMPSLSYLLKLFNENQSLFINKRNGSYVLNPSNDLIRTEEKFKYKFEEISRELNWNGIINEKPTEDQFNELLNSNLFIYIGHGSGHQFIKTTSLKKRNSIAPSLLLGCSSASLQENNLLEPSGTIYSYLIGGCPMVVGNLWDVTDKDHDEFSRSLLEKWGLFNEKDDNMNICDAVKESRDVCYLKYLNGAAPVVYGLPLSLL